MGLNERTTYRKQLHSLLLTNATLQKAEVASKHHAGSYQATQSQSQWHAPETRESMGLNDRAGGLSTRLQTEVIGQ
jgi:hypothetical protein